ncbi:hypothetical protein ASD01_24105 [Ensifer sp. Root423]|nr:hypothetical protein ASD01_24105 [Ensifer sp. Root423]
MLFNVLDAIDYSRIFQPQTIELLIETSRIRTAKTSLKSAGQGLGLFQHLAAFRRAGEPREQWWRRREFFADTTSSRINRTDVCSADGAIEPQHAQCRLAPLLNGNPDRPASRLAAAQVDRHDRQIS